MLPTHGLLLDSRGSAVVAFDARAQIPQPPSTCVIHSSHRACDQLVTYQEVERPACRPSSHTISPRKKRDAETPQTPKRRITTILATLMPSAGCVGLGCRVLAERRQELRCCAGPSMNGAAQESNLPSVGLPRRTGFEVLQGEYKVRGLQPATAEHCPRNRWKRQQRASARLSRKFSPR